jgi:eukaryotic-like serine/threonine-protein kinase
MMPERLGRYEVRALLASGGMASVYLGRVDGPAGFSRPVAIKRLHAHYEQHPEFLAALIDEARLSARVRHPNVVDTLDVVSEKGTMALVLPYVHGESLSRLLRTAAERGERAPPAVVVAIVAGALQGLHAAHDTLDEAGRPLGIVHRDVSPQNVLVGADGLARIADFGIAKAASQLHVTRQRQVKGKLGYMAPEQARGEPVDRRADIFAAGVVLWEALAARRLFVGESDAEILAQSLEQAIAPPGSVVPGIPPELDAVVERALCRSPSGRFPTALAMADALEAALRPARLTEVAVWVQDLAGEQLARRQAEVDRAERASPSPRGAPPDDGATLPTAPTRSLATTHRTDLSAPGAYLPVGGPPTRPGRLWRGLSTLLAPLVATVALVVSLVVLFRSSPASPVRVDRAASSPPAMMTPPFTGPAPSHATVAPPSPTDAAGPPEAPSGEGAPVAKGPVPPIEGVHGVRGPLSAGGKSSASPAPSGRPSRGGARPVPRRPDAPEPKADASDRSVFWGQQLPPAASRADNARAPRRDLAARGERGEHATMSDRGAARSFSRGAAVRTTRPRAHWASPAQPATPLMGKVCTTRPRRGGPDERFARKAEGRRGGTCLAQGGGAGHAPAGRRALRPGG